MQILDNLLIVGLIIAAFFSGLKVAGHYYNKLIAHHEYTERLMAAQNGVGYVALPQEKKHVPIGQPFMDALQKNGRATQKLSH
jgi:hypothetical protein